jgi:hypothetical protein
MFDRQFHAVCSPGGCAQRVDAVLALALRAQVVQNIDFATPALTNFDVRFVLAGHAPVKLPQWINSR